MRVVAGLAEGDDWPETGRADARVLRKSPGAWIALGWGCRRAQARLGWASVQEGEGREIKPVRGPPVPSFCTHPAAAPDSELTPCAVCAPALAVAAVDAPARPRAVPAAATQAAAGALAGPLPRHRDQIGTAFSRCAQRCRERPCVDVEPEQRRDCVRGRLRRRPELVEQQQAQAALGRTQRLGDLVPTQLVFSRSHP